MNKEKKRRHAEGTNLNKDGRTIWKEQDLLGLRVVKSWEIPLERFPRERDRGKDQVGQVFQECGLAG